MHNDLAMLWKSTLSYLHSKKKLKFYYFWYLKNIANKKLSMDEKEEFELLVLWYEASNSKNDKNEEKNKNE